LEEKFATEIAEQKLKIIEADILETDIKNIVGNQEYKLIANIPYYITGQIFKKFLQENLQPILMVVLIQKEVAERITGNLLVSSKKPIKESILSLSIKVYGEPKYISTVKKGSFTPAPKVDSAILLIDNISKDFFVKNNINENKFFNLIKKGFGSKRKLLKSNLEISEEVLTVKKINPLARAEDLSLKDWKNISQNIL
ncbi:MAG TPA: rRNA adenine N-6-methyltransferase family protein, partial [Candidatus Paceibacterota bacterium]